MGRIKETDRLKVLDDHIGHWTEANALPTGPVTLDQNTVPPSTLTLAQFEQLREDYEAKSEAENELERTVLPTLRNDRDILFGANADDENGVWFWLMKYKPAVRLKLGRKTSLARTIPNLGEVTPGDYVKILQRFIDHWEQVNAFLPAPFVLGTLTLANLVAKRDAIEAKAKVIGKKEAALALQRQQREDFFGDVGEDDRDDTSLATLMEIYHVAIEVKFPGQAIVTTLPPHLPRTGRPAAQVQVQLARPRRRPAQDLARRPRPRRRHHALPQRRRRRANQTLHPRRGRHRNRLNLDRHHHGRRARRARTAGGGWEDDGEGE